MNDKWLDAYFERIHYAGSLDVSVETLRALHIAHAFHIPFENLDIHLGRKIQLEPDALIHKLIEQRRGGYCYEMNGLFALVLEAIGFKIDRLFGRIMFGYTVVRPRSHELLLVHLDNQDWVADVAYGTRGLIAPLPLSAGYAERQFTENFRLIQEEPARFTLQGQVQKEWQSFYTFTLEKYLPIDYVPVNYYSSTAPESRFVQQRMAAMPTPEGRITMTNDIFRVSANGVVTETTAETLEQYLQLLERYFGITLRGQETARLGVPLPTA